MLGVLFIPSLREKFLELLERDKEFRYAVIGYLGLDRIEKTQITILEEIKRIWEEIKALRESQNKLWEEANKIWKEVKALRESQEKLWEENRRIWEEIKALREGQEKLWKGQERLWRYVKSGFEGIHEALGVSFEEYVASFIRFMLYELGYADAKVEVRKHMIYEGRIIEINVFSEEPLIVGEVTLTIRDIREAEKEIKKLIKRAEIVSKIYNRKPYMRILAFGNAPEEVIEYLKKLTTKYDIKLIIGREIKEIF